MNIITRPAEAAELDDVIELCLKAFADEAVNAWVVPDPVERHTHMRQLFSESLTAAIAGDCVILAVNPDDEPVAASFWVPRGVKSDEAPDSVEHDDPMKRRMAAADDASRAHRPDAPHLHLSAMAVVPEHRGQGAGGAMLNAGLRRAEELGLPVYLEASTSDNRRLYERVGFRDLGAAIQLPEAGPSLQPMWLDTVAR